MPGSREAAGNCGPKHNMPLHMANMGRVWLALHKEQPLDGRMYSSVSQYVRGIPACSGLLVGARCLGGLFYSIPRVDVKGGAPLSKKLRGSGVRYGAIGFAQGTQNIKVALLFVKNRTGVPAFLLGAYLRKRQGRQAPPRCAVLFMPCAPRSWPSVVDRAWDARLRPIHREQSAA